MAEETSGESYEARAGSLQSRVLTSSTKTRLNTVHNIQDRLTDSDTTLDQESSILHLLKRTYSFYGERASRQAVQECVRILLLGRNALFHAKELATFLEEQSLKQIIAPASTFNLLEWCSTFLQSTAVKVELWESQGIAVTLAQARLLDRFLSINQRDARTRSTLVVSRRAWRAIAKSTALRDTAIAQAIEHLSAKQSAPSAINAVLLGIIAGVCSRIPSVKDQLSKHHENFCSFYTREVVQARSTPPKYIAAAFCDFFAASADSDALERDIFSPIEKALLRSPEVVLGGVLPALIESLPASLDLSDMLKKFMLKSLLSNVKSSNSVIRDGVLQSFCIISERCRDETTMYSVVDDILKALKDVKAADQRAIYGAMLAEIQLSPKLSTKIIMDTMPLASKEANESALSSLLKSVSGCARNLLAEGIAIDPTLTKAYVQGLADKKPSIRRVWALSFGNSVWDLTIPQCQSEAFLQYSLSILDKMAASWTEAIVNPVSAAPTGLLTIAYIYLAVLETKVGATQDEKLKSLIQKSAISSTLLGSAEKPSFLFNHRAYSKLTVSDDLEWFVRALQASTASLDSSAATPAARLGWGHAFIYVMTAPANPAAMRKNAGKMLTAMHTKFPALVGSVVVEGVWQWLRQVALDERDTAAAAAKAGNEDLAAVIYAICPAAVPSQHQRNGSSQDSTSDHLSDLFILCRRPLLPKIKWIELCLRTGHDPATVVARDPRRYIEAVIFHSSKYADTFDRQTHTAACKAAAELAFIAPELMTDQLVRVFTESLDVQDLRKVGPTEAAIYRTPEGQTFVDVLSQKKENIAPSKGSKDYDTLKWEQDLRSQLAKKQGQQKKLSPEEQAKVKAQLAKETEIRAFVSTTAIRLRRGLGIIDALASGLPTKAEEWVGPASDCLFKAINTGAGLIVGNEAAITYLNLSGQASTRLGPLRRFIGVATLRAQGAQLPEELLQEPLGDLVTRVLYRLRFSGEQRPFDVVSLSYILPLIQLVLQERGIGKSEVEEADEQITLSLEFVSLHAHQFANHALPRHDTLDLLVRAMQRYTPHYRMLKDCLNGICHAIAPDASGDEIGVFLRGTIVPEVSVRTACLQAIDAELELPESTFDVHVWLASSDEVEENADLGATIWSENSLQTNELSASTIIPFLQSKDRQLRTSASRSLAKCVNEHKPTLERTLQSLQELYHDKAELPKPERDAYGMPVKKDLSDPWEARHGVALAFRELAPIFTLEAIVPFIQFFIDSGPLSDRNGSVREASIDAAVNLITLRGASKVEELMTIFETTLGSSATASPESDMVNEAVIIMYGALAQHLKPGDKRIPKVIQRLLDTLSTPSETVQYAIATCLPPLVRSGSKQATEYTSQVLEELLHGKKYAARRGAAYGLAGLVRGRGVMVLREARLMSSLKAATEEKKDPNQRQGAFLAFELLSLVLGPVFEPYVIQIVPQLLVGFGDMSLDVREACLDAAKTCFSTLSSFGVKQVLPTLLSGLDEVQWRSKKGACDSLGAMAYLAPQQLAVSLPDIIPPLTTVLNDSHKEVRTAANRALQRFGDVISNPEIKSLVNILLKALSDPTKYTDEALDALMKVNFVHYLDAPSLALVVRILERGLGDRSATKRKSAQIIGSLAHLTERKDLASHLPILVSGLRIAAVDPVPTTRATSSKALGSLVEKLGEDALPDLIPSLMTALKTDTGAGDRLGSAQALSEVLAGLGIGRLEETLPNILQNVSSAKPAVREGFMSLFIFLPVCFGSSFANYLGKIIPPILAGLADDIESIRETALRAGRLLVKNFANKAIDLLLPELQRGLGDDNHRIRLSSVELVGDLLFNLTGISAKAEQEEEVAESATQAGQSLLEVLGEEKRNNVLSALYISRCDTSGLVRSAAVSVWKALVATPRTLREITPTLTQVLIRRLGSSNMEQKVIASNALGELIRKAGEGILATLLPTLEEGLETSTDADAKQGICIALKELIVSASPETLEEHELKLVSIVRSALVASNDEVREAAAEAFDALQQLFGKKVIDQILPNLLGLLQSTDEAENALAALLTLLTEATRSNTILPNLLPTLLKSPITTFNARALASLASVAGSAMTRRLPHVLGTLLDNITTCKDDDRLEALNVAFNSVILSVDEYDGLNTLMSALLGLIKHEDHQKRRCVDEHMSVFFEKAEMDYSRYYADLIRALLISFDDRDPEVVKAACKALTTLTTKRLRKEDMESLVQSTRQVLNQVGTKGHDLPGFNLPKGINAILPIFLQGLINGTVDQKTSSAHAISEIIDKTSADALKPFVTQITGPLIRVVSERSADVKAAILFTLNNLLEKIPLFLKPFLPQLQRTFTKALADTSSEVLRVRAAKALGTLITLTPRIDPLIGELVTGSKTSDAGVRNAMQKALYEVVSKVGANMGESSRAAILGLVDGETDNHETTQITNARLLGALIKVLPADVSGSILKTRVLTSHITKASVLALNSVLLESPTALTDSFEAETIALIRKGIGNPEASIAENFVLAAGKYLLTESSTKTFENTRGIFEALAPLMQPERPIDARRLSLVVIRTVSREHQEVVRPHLAALAPPIFASVRDMVLPIKLAAEAAFLAIFDVVDEEAAVFEKYMSGPGGNLAPGQKRQMQEYFKRVATRLATSARERREAEGGQHGLGKSNDEIEDEREIYSVGKVDLGDASFDD